MNRIKALFSIGATAITLSVSTLFGSGFSILEQSTPGLGRSLAGMASDTTEPSALFFNPAVSAWHDTPQLSLGGNWLHVDARNHLSDHSFGECGNNGGDWCHVPNTSFIYPLADTVRLGYNFSATSGTATRWNPRWVGRYQSIACELSVVEATTSIAWKPLDNLTIGAGFIMQYASMKMKQAVYMDPFPDGRLKLEGDSIAFGYIIGMTFQPIETTTIGLSYRSRMTQKLELDGTLNATPQFASYVKAPGSNICGEADCDMDLPSVVNFGITHQLTPNWKVMGDISWTKASQFDKMTVSFSRRSALGRLTPESTQYMKWKDSWRFAIGSEYKFNDKWTGRIGTAFDRTPVSSPDLRPASLPDLNRYWASCGISYQWNEHVRFDLSYVRIFFEKGEMNITTPDGQKVKSQISGSTDIISYALVYSF